MKAPAIGQRCSRLTCRFCQCFRREPVSGSENLYLSSQYQEYLDAISSDSEDESEDEDIEIDFNTSDIDSDWFFNKPFFIQNDHSCIFVQVSNVADLLKLSS